MARIDETYGADFAQQSLMGRIKYSVQLLGTNIAHKNFTFRHDSASLWKGANMHKDAIVELIKQVQNVNPKFRVTHIDKTTPKRNMFPYLIAGPVEYFVVTDLTGDTIQIYSVYITPSNMEPL